MEANFQRALSLVLKHEGGWADHPADPGGHARPLACPRGIQP